MISTWSSYMNAKWWSYMTLNCKSPGNLWFPFLNSINWVDKVSSKRTHVSNYVIQTLERAYNLSTWQQYFPLFLGLFYLTVFWQHSSLFKRLKRSIISCQLSSIASGSTWLVCQTREVQISTTIKSIFLTLYFHQFLNGSN